MKHKGPLVTLAAGLVFATILMVLNLTMAKEPGTTVSSASSASSVSSVSSATGATSDTAGTATPTPAADAPTVPVIASQVTYAGAAEGGAALAIVVKDGKAVAYLCDGKAAEAWFAGSASGGTLQLIGAKAATLAGTFSGDRAEGHVNAAGRTFSFALKLVAAPSGLYRAQATVAGAPLVGGWVVLDGGQQVGLATLGGTVVTVSPVDTTRSSATVAGTAVTVTMVDGSGL